MALPNQKLQDVTNIQSDQGYTSRCEQDPKHSRAKTNHLKNHGDAGPDAGMEILIVVKTC